jgi:hypothetical protein
MNGNTRLGAGLGLKAEHYAQALAHRADGLWFEVHGKLHGRRPTARLAYAHRRAASAVAARRCAVTGSRC